MIDCSFQRLASSTIIAQIIKRKLLVLSSLPPRKLLKLDVLLLLLSGGFGFAIGYLQNS